MTDIVVSVKMDVVSVRHDTTDRDGSFLDMLHRAELALCLEL